MPPKVAVVVLNYNGRELLEQYLPSVLASTYGNAEVVVVDNGSDDGSVAFLREQFPEVTVVANDENVGFCRGNNAGARAVPDADYLWFLNTDVRVEPDALSTLVEHVEATPKTGIAVPRINEMDRPEVIQSLGYDFGVDSVPRPRDSGRTMPSNPEPHAVTYGSGAALFVRRSVWDEIGGFNEEAFMFEDDVDLGVRCWHRGYRVEVVPDSVVYHEQGGSTGESTPPRVAYHAARSHVQFRLKALQLKSILLGTPGFVLYALALVLGDLVRGRAPKSALYRLAGYLSPLVEFPTIYRQRKRIQRTRSIPDSEFLAPVLYS